MLVLIVPGLLFYCYYEFCIHRLQGFLPQLRSASWLIFYLIGITLISFLGDNHNREHNILSNDMSFVLLAILSIITAWVGARVAVVKKTVSAT